MTYLGIEHLEHFHGLPVHTPDPSSGTLPTADSVAWRLVCDYDEDAGFAALWEQFLETVDTTRVRALVIGPWWNGEYTDRKSVV